MWITEAFAHRVDADLRQRAQAGHRRDVDDTAPRIRAGRGAAGAGDHPLGHFLGDEECAAGIDVEHVVEVLGRDVCELLGGADAGVVDEDVDHAHLGLGVGDGGLDAVGVGDVELDDVRVAAGRLDLGAQRLQALDAARGQHDARAGVGQRACELRAQPAGGAGDEGHAAGQVDLHAHGFTLLSFVLRPAATLGAPDWMGTTIACTAKIERSCYFLAQAP